jgi:inner membrane protein
VYALGELGIGFGLAWLVAYRNRGAVDFRLVLLGSILPDLIDKPIGAILHLDARLWAHSLVFLAAILAVSVLPSLRNLRWVGFGDAVHLLVDLIWQQPQVMLWPFLGLAFPPGEQSFGGYLQILLTDPYVQFGEIVGSILLIAAVWHYRLYVWPVLKQFLKDGKLVEPARA